MQHREVDHTPDERDCGKDLFLSVDSAASTKETTTNYAYVVSPGSTQQAVTSTVDVLDAKPNMSVGASDAVV